MCKITDEYTANGNPLTGFKVAVKLENKYYSPATGVEYKPGQVMVATYENRGKSYGYVDCLLDPSSKYYKEKYEGLTAVFLKKSDAEELRDKLEFVVKVDKHDPQATLANWSGSFVILAMTLSDIRYIGAYDVSPSRLNCHVVMGRHIDSLSEDESAKAVVVKQESYCTAGLLNNTANK